MNIKIEGYTINEIENFSIEEFNDFLLIDEPIILTIGSAEVLGQFSVVNDSLLVELAQIDGGGEGVLSVMERVLKHVCVEKKLQYIEYIVHAIHCANPNLKLKKYLIKRGFVIKNIYNKGEAYYKRVKNE